MFARCQGKVGLNNKKEIMLFFLMISFILKCSVSDSSAQSPVESLFGQVAKTVIYSGATFARLNSRILCTLLTHETERDYEDQPTLFVFNNVFNREHAFRIYADDDITSSMIEEADFDPEQMTIILVHGWLGGIHHELWLSEAKNAALQGSFARRYNTQSAQFYTTSQNISSSVNNSSINYELPEMNYLNNEHLKRTQQNDDQRKQRHQYQRQQQDHFRPNVIIVDWSEFAQGTLYTATQNSYKVARRLARLLEQLAKVGKLRPELMHCLGHSIGTHICGQAARKAFPPSRFDLDRPDYIPPTDPQINDSLKAIKNHLPRQRMGRITALDPGGFCYELGIKNETTYLGLRPSDAILVDAYYSNRSPFGNKYQVATYNVRINNGYFQRSCSVWRNPEVATEYFRAAVRFTLGNVGHNDILTCDHYFATRFASQLLPKSCSYVAYACDSYRNYLRGRCGLCNSPRQCYPMDFEYQRPNASISNAIEQMLRYSTLKNDEFGKQQDLFGGETAQPPGGVPYANRQIYYMKVDYDKPYCAITFRLRVNLDTETVDIRSFRNDWLKLYFYGKEEEIINVRDASTGKVSITIPLYGPWAENEEEGIKMLEDHGVDESTRTALFEIDSTVPHLKQQTLIQSNPIDSIVVEYDNALNRRQGLLSNPILSIQIDNLSSADPNKLRNISKRSVKMLKLSQYLCLTLIAINVLIVNGNVDEQEGTKKGSTLAGIRKKFMNYMLNDLKGCENVQKTLENLSPNALRHPSEACAGACKEENLGFSGDYKYSGSAVLCCCSNKSLTDGSKNT